MASVTEHLLLLQKLTQTNLEILQTINESFYTKQNHLYANINDENQAVVSALNSILNAQMQFSSTFTLTANDALDVNNQSNLIGLMKQTI
jgi:hypothetical protein